MKSLTPRFRSLSLCLIAALALAGLWACGDDSGDPDKTKTYEAHGITFDYPANWKKRSLKSDNQNSPNALWKSDGIALTEDDVILVSAFKLKVAVTETVFKENQQDIVDEVLATTEGELLSDPEVASLAGLPAVIYSRAGTSANGKDVSSLLFFIFKDDIEYFINCQATDKKLDEVDAACTMVADSFEVTGPPTK